MGFKKDFKDKLYAWSQTIHRPLPWKAIDDPYLIWLSEILLQQTRVDQGLPYYLKFKEHYPTVADMANAPEDDIMKLWEGLGYYSRARNMHATAKYIALERNGIFPNTYREILDLKGVGPYTAAAIASFAFNLPHAVVDGNVYRVLARIFAIDTPSDSTEGKKQFAELAHELLDKENPGKYNQAIMDFGATQCTPKNPACSDCVMSDHCQAFAKQAVEQYPIKTKKLKRKKRYFNYLVLNIDGQVYIRKRTQKDIWQKLYEFPLIETTAEISELGDLEKSEGWQQWLHEHPVKIDRKSKPYKQTLTHQLIHACFWEFHLDAAINLTDFDFQLVDRKNLRKFAFPKIIDWYLGDKSLYLNLF